MNRSLALCTIILSANINAADIFVDRKSEKSYNVYDRGNIYYIEKKSNNLYKTYPKSVPNDEVSYPSYVIVKDPYGDKVYDDE